MEHPPRQLKQIWQRAQGQYSVAYRIRCRKESLDYFALRRQSTPDGPPKPRREDMPQPASACRMMCRNLLIPLPDCRTTYKAPFTMLHAFAPRHLALGTKTQDVD